VRADSSGMIDAPKGSVAIIDMVGPVMKYGDMCTYGAEEIVAALYAADRNPNIIGTIF
jgi:protease-4